MQAQAAFDTSFSIHGEWLRSSQTKAVMKALTDAGATPRFVGGCVRDAVMGRTVNDVDLAVDILPEESLAALEAARIKAIPTGLKHGTITAVVDGQHFEITTLRTDIKTDGRHAEVAFTKDWEEDAKRRDFTMNALYADPDGTVYDPLGSGIADASARRIRFINDARARIEEDYLRILRLFRFHAWFGKGEMDGEAVVASAGLAGGIASLSKERIGQEMLKLLSAQRPANALTTMAQTGVLAQAIPSARVDAPVMVLENIERRFGISPDPLRRLSLISWGVDAAVISKALRLSNDQFRALKLRRQPVKPVQSLTCARRIGYRRGEAAARDTLLNNAAWTEKDIALSEMQAVTEGAQLKMPISSADILGLGVQPGAQIGEGLILAEEHWIESDFILDKASLLDHVRSRLAL